MKIIKGNNGLSKVIAQYISTVGDELYSNKKIYFFISLLVLTLFVQSVALAYDPPPDRHPTGSGGTTGSR